MEKKRFGAFLKHFSLAQNTLKSYHKRPKSRFNLQGTVDANSCDPQNLPAVLRWSVVFPSCKISQKWQRRHQSNTYYLNCFVQSLIQYVLIKTIYCTMTIILSLHHWPFIETKPWWEHLPYTVLSFIFNTPCLILSYKV